MKNIVSWVYNEFYVCLCLCGVCVCKKFSVDERKSGFCLEDVDILITTGGTPFIVRPLKYYLIERGLGIV